MAEPVLKSPINPHFFQPLLPGFDTNLNIPVTFLSKYLQGRVKLKTAKLRSDILDTVWEVKVEDGRRITGGGWKKFVTTHDYRIGDVIVFRHEGDLVFHVTALGPSCCEIKYTSPHKIDDDHDDSDDHQEDMDIRPIKKRAKKNPRREEITSLDHSCFEANVSVSSLDKDQLYVPVDFARSNGLSKAKGIILLDEMGRSWKLSLHHGPHGKSSVQTYLRHGWRKFCRANGMRRGHCTFKLVQSSGTPVIRLCQAGYRPDAESSTHRSCFVRSLTPASLRNDVLYIPKGFLSSNGLKEGCCDEIVLKNEYGETWSLVMRYHKSENTSVISRGWRSFCEANGLKARDSFRFKLVSSGGKPVLCLCPAETNPYIRVESSVGTDDNTLSTDPRHKGSSGEKSVLCLCHAEANHDIRVESSVGTDDNTLSTDPSSGEESSETEKSEEKNIEEKGKEIILFKEENEEESIEHKSRLMECSNIEKWKDCSRTEASFSQSQCRFVSLTLTPYCFTGNKLRLPVNFTRLNGINKPGEITLVGQDGVNHMVRLVKEGRHGRMRLGSGWKEFCEVHDIKIGESFVLELLSEKDTSPVLKFCTKVTRV